jgi:UDP-N-acetylmuramoyl-L-alanyl-D-glutamate--2,6-diaminopimelate ligase
MAGRAWHPAVSRPPVPAGPYLVAGLGRAGRAAVETLIEVAGAAAVAAWAPEPDAAALAVAERVERAGGRAWIGPWADGGLSDHGWRCVVKSPGLAADAPPLLDAARRDAAVLDEAELGWRLGRWRLVGVTGTNGKTTVCRLVTALLGSAPAAVLTGGNTDGKPPLSALATSDADWVVGELSSYQLEGSPALLPEIAVLTNLTRDHLHRHGTMRAYAAAKRRLFVRDDAAAPVAILNIDDALGRRIAAEAARRGSRVLRYGRHPSADVRIEAAAWTAATGDVRLRLPGGEALELTTGLPGEHNADNVAAAVAVAHVVGLSAGATADALAAVTPAPGRFEPIDAGQPYLAVVDFAHNPDAIRQALLTARPLAGARGRVRVVLTASGALDPGKRPGMGRVAAELADHLILTTGSLLGEPREAILAGLTRGAREAADPALIEVVPERRTAIARLVRAAQPGDVVLVLGRGPLPTLRDSHGGSGQPFDDRAVLREELERCG